MKKNIKIPISWWVFLALYFIFFLISSIIALSGVDKNPTPLLAKISSAPIYYLTFPIIQLWDYFVVYHSDPPELKDYVFFIALISNMIINWLIITTITDKVFCFCNKRYNLI